MIMFGGLVGLIAIAAWIYCFIDVLLTPEQQCRNLPKLAWVFIVLLFADFGAIAWLIAGRPWVAKGTARPGGGGTPATKRTVPMNPDDDEEFLASLRARAEEQRRRARGTDSGEDKV